MATFLKQILPILFITIILVDSKLNRYCICVPFWQCKEDISGFNADGIDLVDIRFFHSLRSYIEKTPAICTGDFDVCCKLECGIRGEDDGPLPKILSNQETKFAEFPWMLAILRNQQYHCGASLIHPRVALTAAHCVKKLARYTVRAGEFDWGSNNEPLKHQERKAKKIIIHPQFNTMSLIHDISLIILDRSFELNEHIGLICLPPQSMTFDNNNCLATGWGQNKVGMSTQHYPKLKKVDLKIMPRAQCTRRLQETVLGRQFVVHRSFICAGGEVDRDTCKGDGGGPLVCPVDDNLRRYEQVGIVSWGLSCGMTGTPGVYVDVALYSNWINNVIRMYSLDPQIYIY